MPRMTPHKCREPGCGTLIMGKAGFCEAHRKQARRRQEIGRRSAAMRGYDQEWRSIRAGHLAANPDCRRCGQPANEVDHILPLAAGGDKTDPGNLQSLCKTCHSVKTGRHDRGRKPPKGMQI